MAPPGRGQKYLPGFDILTIPGVCIIWTYLDIFGQFNENIADDCFYQLTFPAVQWF